MPGGEAVEVEGALGPGVNLLESSSVLFNVRMMRSCKIKTNTECRIRINVMQVAFQSRHADAIHMISRMDEAGILTHAIDTE